MPVSKDPDDKHEPSDHNDNEHSDSNELPDESSIGDNDQTTISDCSSENGSSRQSSSDADSGNYSDYSSKISTSRDVTTSDFSSENENTSDSDLSNDLLDSLTSNYSNYHAFDSSSITSSHSSIENKSRSVFKIGTSGLKSDDEKKNKNVFDTVTVVNYDEKVHKLKKEVNKAMERFRITSLEGNGKKSTSVDKVKKISTYLPKLLRNTDYIDDADHADSVEDLSLNKEKFKSHQKHQAKYLIRKFEVELTKLAGANNAADSIAAIKGYLKHLESKLATGHLDDDHLADVVKYLPEMLLSIARNTALNRSINDSISSKEKTGDSSLVRFKTEVVRDGSDYQINDEGYLEYLRKSSLGEAEKYYSKIEDCKQFQNGEAINRQDITVMCNLDGTRDCGQTDNQADGQYEQVDNQGNQGDNQGNEGDNQGDQGDNQGDNQGDQGDDQGDQGDNTGIPGDISDLGIPQAANLSEDATFSYQPCHQVQGYSSLLAAHEEGAKGKVEMALQLPKPFKIPRNSELVPYSSHPYLAEGGQHMTSLESQIQRFSEILAAKGVSMDSIIKFIRTSAGCIPRWHYHISELLSSIVVVTDNALQVFEVENICKAFPTVIQLVLMMQVRSPIPVREPEDDLSSTFPSTLNGSMGTTTQEHLRQFSSGAIHTAPPNILHDQFGAPANDFQVTTNAVQETDDDVGNTDDEIRPIYECHIFQSAEACCANENEAFQLYVEYCRMCGVAMCRGERIAEEMRAIHQNARRCIHIERNQLLSRLTSSVNFNTVQNCILEILQRNVSHTFLQRNVALGRLDIWPFVRGCQVLEASHDLTCELNSTINPRVQHSSCLSSFINLQNSSLSSFMAASITQHHSSLINSEKPVPLVNVQDLIDTLCNKFNSLLSNQSGMLRPFIQAVTTTGYLSSCENHIQNFLSALPHSIVQNGSSKLFISMTVVPDGVPIDMDQLNNGLLNSLVALRCQDSITSSLQLPPINAFNDVSIIVNWTIMIQSSSVSFLEGGFDSVETIDPVEAVNLHGRESLVGALEPTYGHHAQDQNNNAVHYIDGLVENPIPDPIDWYKTNCVDIFSYFSAENPSYEHQHHPLDNDISINSHQVNCELKEATISDDASDSEATL